MRELEERECALAERKAATDMALLEFTRINDGKRTTKKWVYDEVVRLRGLAVAALNAERLDSAKLDEIRVRQIEQLRGENERLRSEIERMKSAQKQGQPTAPSGSALSLCELADLVRVSHLHDDSLDQEGQAIGALAAVDALMKRLVAGAPLRDIICAVDPVLRALDWYMTEFMARGREIKKMREEKVRLEREREKYMGLRGLLAGEGLDKVKQKLRAVGESIARGDERPKQATQDLFNSLHALIGGLVPDGAGLGVPLADRLCNIADAIHGVGMSLVNMPPAAPGEHLTDVQMAKLAGKIAAVRTALGEHPLLDRLELLGAMLAQKGNPEGKLVFLLEVVTETLAAEAGVRRMLRKNAALIDGASFTRNAFASLGGPRECRECGKAGDSDLDIVHSRACSYAAMRAFIGFPVLQEEG